MTKNHLKARAAPRTWNIARKHYTFTTRPNPGSQKMEMTLPLGTVLKSAGVAITTKEVAYIIKNSEVQVNGVRRHDKRFGVGFMDSISIPATKQQWVLTMDDKGRLLVEETKTADAKQSQVRSLQPIKGGKLQLSLSDGRTIVIPSSDAKKYSRGATVVVSIPKGEVASVHQIEQSANVILTSGKHRGKRGTVASIDGDAITIETEQGTITSMKQYAFVLSSKAAGGKA